MLVYCSKGIKIVNVYRLLVDHSASGTTALNRQRKCLHATFSYSGEESTVSPRRVKKGEGEEMGGVVKCNKHTNAPRSINHTKPSSRPVSLARSMPLALAAK